MPRLTDEELACKLEQQQVDRVILNDAASRIRQCELDQLLDRNAIISAVRQSPLLDPTLHDTFEKLVLDVKIPRRSSARMSSLAGRVLRGYHPTRDEIEALAASVLSQDQEPG